VLEALRQPLEDGSVMISRAAGSAAFPARFQSIGAANPCRRGCASLSTCVCTAGERRHYLARLSRPLLNRIDLHLDLLALPYGEIAGATIDSAASPLTGPRPVAIPLPFRGVIRGGFCGFLG
jgi:magnesium chelatase family protein